MTDLILLLLIVFSLVMLGFIAIAVIVTAMFSAIEEFIEWKNQEPDLSNVEELNK